MALTLGLLLTLLLSAGYAWLTISGEALIDREEMERAELTTEALATSLKSIMLNGFGVSAHDWLQRVTRLQEIESAAIYRLDGVEAFIDSATVLMVNKWLGEERFHSKSNTGKPGQIPPQIAEKFSQVTQGKTGQVSIRKAGSLTFLYPIRAENSCRQCHGYTNNPLRGVLALRISTTATEARLQGHLYQTAILFAAISVLLILGAWISIRQQVISPLSNLVAAADKIRSGDLSQGVHLDRNDEFGAVAEVFDDLIVHLEKSNKRLLAHEIELELINDELASANKAKTEFLANTSHELRTPLNAIIGFSELLGNPQLAPLTEKQKRYVDHVHVSGKRLLHIINDLLDISKIEAGMMEIEEVRFTPLQIARQTVDELTPLSDAKQLHLALREDTSASASVVADARKLHQMLINLIGNAIKFTPEAGRVDVSIHVEAGAKHECRIIIAVEDTGIGISEDDQRRIFEPFVQAKGGLDRQHEGTGLGLALTRRQINLLGGDLQLESKPGAGSRFTISMPAKQIPATGAQEPAIVAAKTSFPTVAAPEQGPRPRILVTDGNLERGEAVVRILQQEEYNALFADTSMITQTATQFCPFILMLGVSEQAGETYSNLQALKTQESTRTLPVILIGGRADDPEFSMGTIDLMETGIGRQDILDTIARHSRHVPTHPDIPTVLVVDDDAAGREFIKETLVSEGYRTLLAANGEEGISIAIEHEPDIIILDLMMPGVTGFDVVNRLRRHPAAADIPIMIYTARDISREEALHLGRDVERVLLKGADGRAEILRQLHKLELIYPVQAHLVDATLRCFNHRYLRRRLGQEIASVTRHGQELSLIGWQIDGYADYVRQHGERWGIAALKEMIETVKTTTRRGDICARIDESRFALLLPGIPATGATHVVEKLRARIRHQRFPLPQARFGSFSISVVVIHYDTNFGDEKSLLKMLTKRIDEAASASKRRPGKSG